MENRNLQQNEVRKIMQKYVPHDEDKMETLRRLDKSAAQTAGKVAIFIGVISSLMLGFGMASIMEFENLFAVGIIFGIIGIVGMLVAYPVFKALTARKRKELAPQILKLCDELQ